MANQRVKGDPRISVNSLAEYLVSGAARRQRIIQEQKRPKTFMVTYYDEAEEAIAEYLASQRENTSVLDRVSSTLKSEVQLKEWELTRRATGVEAVETFRSFAEDLPLENFILKRGAESPRRSHLNGVSISVRPELHFTVVGENKNRIGAMKLYFSKNEALSEDRARYAATVLHQHIETQYPIAGLADYRMCIVLDVFAQKFYTAPRTYKRKRQDIEAACSEIARSWSFS